MRCLRVFLLTGLFALAACSQHGSTSDEDSLGQVVARVNGEEITVSQLNAELATVSANGQDPKAVKEEVLRAIVFRTLLRQAALKEKYDRRPQVRLLMDAARDKVLADSYVNGVAGSQKAPSQADIAKFIADHPLAFGDRRIYRFERLMLAADQYSDNLVPMFDQKPQVQTFDQLEAYLNGKRIPFTLTDVQLPSTDFPKQVQDELIKFHVGDNVVVRGPQSIIILKIKGWTEMPVQEADAQRIAATALQQEALSERTTALRTQMVHDAKIEFDGEFAGMDADEPKAPPPAAPSASAPNAPAPADSTVAPIAPAAAPGSEIQAPASAPDASQPAATMPPGANSTTPQEGTAP
ncbi:MAG: EpsD family peptidyl-prolyl cis-trans isomerase [Alphaproteobacteria bacterium]